MEVCSLTLTDFRSYTEAELAFGSGLTAVVGANGEGKTNLLEAIGFVGGVGSLRGAADGALIREGAESAVIRCHVCSDDGRDVLIEAEIAQSRPNRVQVNRQRVGRRRELIDVLTVTVFSPDDLELVKGEPSGRRRWIDDALAAVRPGHGVLRSELERILRQRNALLRQAAGRASGDIGVSLDVWDAKLSVTGDELRRCRRELLGAMQPRMAADYGRVARSDTEAGARYVSSWGEQPLAEALAAARNNDLRRATTTVGPQRDDIAFSIGGLPARSHASQGEQRSLALALRLAVDAEIRERRGVQPVLLLDDVFSELDPDRAAALLDALPEGQRILTAATGLPAGARPDRVIRISNGVPRRALQ